ncbi:LysR family transcriptional regulator [Caproicibacterium sp. NSD3]
MNDRQLEYMLAIVKEGNISHAADKLRVSQPSLSQMIKQIENNLGTQIFKRYSNPIEMTYAGQQYISAAKKILMIQKNLHNEIHDINNEVCGVVSLGMPIQRGLELISYLLPKFYKKYPHVTLKLVENGSAAIEEMVLNGEIDIGCVTTYPHYEELDYRLVENEEMILFVDKDTDFAKSIPAETPITLAQAQYESFIALKKGHSSRTVQDQLVMNYNIHPRILIETGSIEIAKRAAIACHAVMLCPRNYLNTTPDLLNQACIYPILDIQTKREFFICHRKDLYLPKYMRDLIEILLQAKQVEKSTDDKSSL